MDLDPVHLLKSLLKNSENDKEGAHKCNQLLINLNDFLTKEQVYSHDLDLLLQHIFNRSQGFPNFVVKVSTKKEFKLSVIKIFEIIYVLINSFPTQLEKYVTEISDTCFKIIKSSLVSSDEKVKALEVLTLSFEKIDKSMEMSEYYTEMYNNLLKTISIKKCDSVEEKIYIALGTFSKRFSFLMTIYSEQLRNIFLRGLETQMLQKNFSNRALCGLFTGLNNFCESFPFDSSLEEDMAIIKKIFKYIDKVAVPKGHVKIGNRAALSFLANNMSLFIKFIIEKYEYWHQILLNWLQLGSDDQKVGILVIEAFYRSLGEFLLNDVSLEYKNVTMYFYDYLREKLNEENISSMEKRLCLEGLSAFSGVYHIHLQDKELKDLLHFLVQNFEQTYVFNQEPSPDSLEYLPFYIQTVTKFVHFRKISNSEIFCLQKSTIMMIKVFPQLPYSCHTAVTEALVSTFYFLLVNDEKLCDNFIENVVYEGVVWSCSHRHMLESDIEGNSHIITVRNYFNLWKGLLKILPQRKFDKYGIILHDRKFILVKVTDKLIRTLLILINKLDVTVMVNNSNDPVTDIQAAYKVSKIDDFAIFLNLVDFYQEIFEEFDPSLLKKCLCKLIQHLVSKCDKYPLISGFYKLLSCCLKTVNNFFEDSDATQDMILCHSTLVKFLETLLNKVQQFKGDLLVACLCTILEYPTAIIQKMLLTCIPAFKIMFEIGRTYIKLTFKAIDTLENWQKTINSEEMERFLVQIVPLLDCYLQSRSLGDLTGSDNIQTRRKTAQALKKRKVIVDSEPELTKLQIKILNFIGQQKVSICKSLAFSENNINLSVSGGQQHLKITLPYQDTKLEVCIEKLVPRIVHLALNSTDRKTRVTACELLQAAVIVFLGKTKPMPESALCDLNDLLNHIAVPLLKLGCDLDQVVEQIFRPLCFQLIHWYTHASQLRKGHGAIIIEAVLDGITHPNDSALRDFCGKCINEYIKWTIKQSNEKSLAKDPINLKILLKKMRFYSTHPDSFKKLGAALIFNNIYREVREEIALLSMFWIEFLHIFVTSLSDFENDTKDDTVTTQINTALIHIQRGFIEKAELFNKNDEDRRIPVDLDGGLLKDVVVWLLKQSGSRNPLCRERCINMVCKITPHTRNFKNLNDFVEKHFENTWFTNTYEYFLNDHPTMRDITEYDSNGPIKWMQAFLCALDGYIFAFQHELISNLNSKVTLSIHHFIEILSTLTLDGAFAIIQPKLWTFTDFEKQFFDSQKTQAVKKILQLLFLKNSETFHTQNLWNLVSNLLFNQHILGFENFHTDRDDNLLKEFVTKLSEKCLSDLVQVLDEYLSKNIDNNLDLKQSVTYKQRSIFRGLNILQSFSLERFEYSKYTSGIIKHLLDKFLDDLEGDRIYFNNLQNTTITYCVTIFDSALIADEEFEILIDYLYKPYQVQCADNKEVIHFGCFLLNLFGDCLLPKLSKRFDFFFNLSITKYQTMNQTIEIITIIMTYLGVRKNKPECEIAIKTLLLNWNYLEMHFIQENSDIGKSFQFVKNLQQLVKLCRVDSEPVKVWLIRQFQTEQDLNLKSVLDSTVEVFYLMVDIFDVSDDENVSLSQSLIHMKNKLLSSLTSPPPEVRTLFFEKILSIIPQIKTPELIIFLLELYGKDFAKINNFDLNFLLKNYIVTDQEIQKITLFKVHDLYTSDEFDSNQKYRLITETSALFHFCSMTIFEDYCEEKMLEFVSVLKKPTTASNLIEKILTFSQIGILFSRCSIDYNDTEISKLSTAADLNSNKALVLFFLKNALSAIKDSVENCSDLLRSYKCHVYNAMTSIVSNSLRDENFYTKLFIRQENNTDILWSSLVDTEKKFLFQTDFESLPKRKKVLVNIRNEVKANKKLMDSQFQSTRYMESARVYSSSLCEDLTKFDFTNNIVRTQMEDESEITEDKIHVNSEIELDCTDINTHECMANVCGLIEHMVDTGIVQLPSENEGNYELPAWANGIRALLLNQETHINVKIFWVKVIDNTIHIFKHFAQWFIEPLLKFLVDGCAGTNINYFLTDVVGILATWSTEASLKTETEISLASELLRFFIDNLNNERQDIFKYHLELIRLLVESWKSSVEVPFELIYAKLNIDPTSKKVAIGIHVSSIFLSNKILPFDPKNMDFCKTLFDIVRKNNHKNIYKPCAETIGILLKVTVGKDFHTKIFGNVHVLIKKMTDHDKYAHVLEAIVLHYPEVADQYHLSVLLSRIHGVPKPMKIIYLKIILSRSSILNTVSDFTNEKWDLYVQYDNLEVQLLSLEVIYTSLDILRGSSMFKSIIESVSKHVSNTNILCRNRVFDIMIKIYDKKNSVDLVDLSKKVLVQGLIDTNPEIRQKVYNFWKTNSHLSREISSRFAYILTNLYENNTENDFLGYSCYLLLDPVKNSDDYVNMLFEHPLEDCDFQDYNLQTNWRLRHLSMAPLFIETVRSSSEDFETVNVDFNKLRETQSFHEFAPTQRELTQFTMPESSLYISSQDESTFVNPNLVPISQKYRGLKRRFLRDKSKIGSQFAQRETQKSIDKSQHRRDVAKERENKVVIYRKYRKGDLPDVQINLQAFLDPLQALTLHDGETSKILYSEIFECLWHKIKSDEDFVTKVALGVKTIFTSSIHFNRNLVRTLFDILLLCKSSINIPAELVVTVSHCSGLRALGVLLLEEYLFTSDESPSTSKRVRGVHSTNNIELWIKLVELYKEINEWDTVKSIFLRKIDCSENMKEAILAESHNKWTEAQNYYEKLLQSEDSPEVKDYCYESYFKCFAHLGDWKGLTESIDKTVSGWKNLWDQDFGQHKLMPWYINGHLKNSLFSGASNQFFTDINQSLNSENLEYLENNFSEEIAMLWILQNDLDEANKYVNAYLKIFLNNWQQLDSLYSNARFNKLLKLRNVIDVKKFLLVSSNNISIREIINYWKITSNEKIHSILLSEERLLYRRQFVNLLTDRIKSSNDEEEFGEFSNGLNDVKLKLLENFSNTAIEQNNFYVTKKYLTDFSQQNSLKSKLIISKLAYIKSTLVENIETKTEYLMKGCKTLDQILNQSDQPFLKLLASITLFNHLQHISTFLTEDNQLYERNKSQVLDIMGVKNIASPSEISLCAVDKLRSCLCFYENELENDMESNDAKCKTVADAYVKLAYFTMKRGPNSFDNFMVFVLKAMKFDSAEGRQLFPCIIMSEYFNKKNEDLFLKETENIPIWMFLAWIPQILVNIDSSKVSALSPLVIKIAKMYPQAIMYAYRLSKENYKLEHPDSRVLTEQLDNLLLSNDHVNNFLKALSFVSIPAAVLLYYIRKMIKIANSDDLEQLKIFRQHILNEVFDSKPDSRDVNSFQGNMFKKIAKFEKELKNIDVYMKKKQPSVEITKLLKKICDELGKMLADKRHSQLLKDYSPWLSNFSGAKENYELEIPGQYDGKRMPVLRNHVKIAGFCQNVSIMPSLRKPIKITIVGNDTKQYPFLIKFGEDVRQDQRIQQLFCMMNEIFEADERLQGQKFSILTYQVIPLTTNLGMIQWIDKTKSLQEAIKSSTKNFDNIAETYYKWVYKNKNLTELDAYGKAAMSYNRDQTILKFKSLVSCIEWDVLKSFFSKLCTNKENFYILRNNFIVSYAVMCVSQWILGVGDRHLSNSLISLQSGKVLGIDFGHAFGTATQILPVPELVPFRLTPHLVYLMEPLGENGLFREVMIHTLNSLRNNSLSLLSTMKVFIEEPSLDWIEHSSRFAEGINNDMWFPSQKMNQAQRKLEGVNPKILFIEDLKTGQKKESYTTAYCKLVEGHPEHDIRARMEDDHLSVEDQVDCLIDQATDYNLLGRMFQGWTAWV